MEREPGAARRRDLSRDELAVLRGIALGQDFGTIAKTLFLAPKTVAYHATKLRRLLEAPNLPALVAIAFVAGILTNDMLGLGSFFDIGE